VPENGTLPAPENYVHSSAAIIAMGYKAFSVDNIMDIKEIDLGKRMQRLSGIMNYELGIRN
jgi:hypothetical protein